MTPPRRRRGRASAAAVVVAGVLFGLVAGTVPAQAAPWQGSTARTATVAAASWSSRLVLVAGAGTVADGGSSWSMPTSLTTTRTGYLDLANSGTVPATLSASVVVGSVVGGAPVTVCSVAWNTTVDSCAGTTTTVPLSALVGSSSGTYTSPALVAVGDAAHLRVRVGGVASTVTVTTTTVVPRPAADRTLG